MAYETLPESDFNLSPDEVFKLNVFADISPWLERRLELLRI